ncbi:hypothetical protein NHQ30_007511 [Ciborinia camelliae]|nr:hypothetical protein NHQ30_007511 [Ciborinia camelliae]
MSSPSSVVEAAPQPRQISDVRESKKRLPDFLEPTIDLDGPKIKMWNSIENNQIHNLKTKILDGTAQEELENNFTSRDSKEEHSLKLRFQPENGIENGIVYLNSAFVVNESNSPADFAILNEKTSQVLFQMKNLGCHFETHSSKIEKLGDLSTEKGMYRYIDVTLSGPKSIGVAVGTFLSAKKMYLQHPETGQLKRYAEYENPHFLRFDYVPRSTIVDSNKPHTADFYNEYSLDIDLDAKNDTKIQPRLYNRVTKILDSLTRFRNLKRIEADIKIMTPLMQHQAEALDFIAQREFGPIPDEYSLWTFQPYENQICYQHRISGDKVRGTPMEYGGGILADDMGLGKTLTVLARIMQTSKEAKVFFDSSPQNFDHDSNLKYKVRSRSTLVIVQTSLLIDGWREEIAKHCRGYVNINIYHGRGRETNREVLADADIVLSTYDTVSAESSDSESPVYGIEWFRLVLDEGTPIQNSLDDLAALVSFIRSSPLNDLSVFRKHIINPLLKEKDEGTHNLRALMDSICLRRTKKLLNLPSVEDVYRSVHFSVEEKLLYNSTRQEEIRAMKQQDSQARNKKGYYGIFQLQLQLRRLCNHGTFLKKGSSISKTDSQFDPEQALGLLQEKNISRCHYCEVEITGLDPGVTCRGRFTNCGHLLCFGCISRYENSLISDKDNVYSSCSICNQQVTNDACFADEVGSICETHLLPVPKKIESTGISSKMKELLKDIRQNQTEGKSIIFSCWTTSLDLVGHHLKLSGLSFERIDGSCTHAQRHDILERYTTDEKTRILIMTTGTGAEGLNLTIANYVYILEPQWNPMVESQAIARVQRIGQNRDVKIFRYIVEDTVEKAS